MEKSQPKNSSLLDYVWPVLMIICLGLLTAQLVISSQSSDGNNKQLIEKTYTKRK